MTEKELKRLSRVELLEMLVEISKESENLKSKLIETEEKHRKEVAALKSDYEAKLDAQQKQLDDRRIAIANAGSIAEACMKINGVFEAAQAAAEQYLENIRHSGNENSGNDKQ